VGNVTLPTPVVVAGVAVCLLAGGVVGLVVAPDPPDHSTATVASFDPHTSVLCLKGDSVKDEPRLNDDGELCAVWRHAGRYHRPQPGQRFRYVTVRTTGTSGGEKQQQTVIYGDVVE
jgi:hypothetical protein